MTQGIYAITHIPSGRVYVGQSNNIQLRITAHLNTLRRGNHANKNLQEAFLASSENDFEFNVLEVVDDLSIISEREIYWAKHLQALQECGGFNIAEPGLVKRTDEPCRLRWAVHKLVEQHGKTMYALSDKLHGQISRNTLYKISRNETDRTDLKTLELLKHGLTAFLGVEVEISDLFELTPDAPERES